MPSDCTSFQLSCLIALILFLYLTSHRSVPRFNKSIFRQLFDLFIRSCLLSHWTVPPFLRFLCKIFFVILLVLSFFVCVFIIAWLLPFVKHFLKIILNYFYLIFLFWKLSEYFINSTFEVKKRTDSLLSPSSISYKPDLQTPLQNAILEFDHKILLCVCCLYRYPITALQPDAQPL